MLVVAVSLFLCDIYLCFLHVLTILFFRLSPLRVFNVGFGRISQSRDLNLGSRFETTCILDYMLLLSFPPAPENISSPFRLASGNLSIYPGSLAFTVCGEWIYCVAWFIFLSPSPFSLPSTGSPRINYEENSKFTLVKTRPRKSKT